MKKSTARAIGNIISWYIYGGVFLALGMGGLDGFGFIGLIFLGLALYHTIWGLKIFLINEFVDYNYRVKLYLKVTCFSTGTIKLKINPMNFL